MAVIGAGPRGQSFALRCLAAGYSVTLEDVLSSRLRGAEQAFRERPEAQHGNLKLASSVEEAVRSADLAIDFVPDELESKLEILSMMDRMAPPRTLFCTPTMLSLSDLASCTYRPGQCVALQPFPELPADELILVRGVSTTESTVAATVGWLTSLGVQVRIIAEASTDTTGVAHP